jgi:serine/threonine-protein kinase
VCQLVVLKTVHPERRADREATQRLIDEARWLARIHHPNIVQIHNVLREDGLPVIAMEYLAGPSLATLLADANDLAEFSLELRIAIVARLLRGLEHIHRLRDFDGRFLGVVHGAVAPENVIITYDGQVKLIDFGRARLADCASEQRPGRRALPYLAPEQLGGAPDSRSDLFAVGIILWEMLARRPLWGQIPASTIVHRLLAGDIPRLRDAAPAVDTDLERIASRALTPQRDARYRSAAELRADLERYLKRRGRAISDSAIAELMAKAGRAQRQQMQKLLEGRLSELGLSLARVARRALPPAGEMPSAREALAGRIAAPVLGAGLVVAAIAALTVLLRAASPGTRGEEARGDAGRAGPVQPLPLDPVADAVNDRSDAPRARWVRLEVSVQPLDAVLYLDGQRLSSNPLRATMVRDSVSHTLRGAADGYLEFISSFRLDSNLRIDAELRPIPLEDGVEDVWR